MKTFMRSPTDPVQLACIGTALVLDVIGLVWINRMKRKTTSANSSSNDDNNNNNNNAKQFTWTTKRNTYWALMLVILSLAISLDAKFEISTGWMFVKSYAFCFPLGLLDFYFSNVKSVPLSVLVGASLWCSTLFLKTFLLQWFGMSDGRDLGMLVVDCKSLSLLYEMPRFVTQLLGVGLLSDLLFSPMHRVLHHPKLYKYLHKEHHTYVNELTSLVLYHGHFLDDFLMPFTTVFGGTAYVWLLSLFGWESFAFSNVTLYLVIFNTLLSHAHDLRCARLLAPLPDELNYVAYHYVHHVSPSQNFGLTEPSDRLWDWLLGVKTIRKVGSNDLVSTNAPFKKKESRKML